MVNERYVEVVKGSLVGSLRDAWWILNSEGLGFPLRVVDFRCVMQVLDSDRHGMVAVNGCGVVLHFIRGRWVSVETASPSMGKVEEDGANAGEPVCFGEFPSMFPHLRAERCCDDCDFGFRCLLQVTRQEVDEDDPLWCVNARIDDLLIGFGASEDHQAVVNFLVKSGLSNSIAERVHKAICGGERDQAGRELVVAVDRFVEVARRQLVGIMDGAERDALAGVMAEWEDFKSKNLG